MRAIGQLFFFSFQESKEVLRERFDYKISLNTLKFKASNLNIALKIGNISYIPEELLPFLIKSMQNKSQQERKDFKEEVSEITKKYEKIIEKYDQNKY